jgi:hypothetical protein
MSRQKYVKMSALLLLFACTDEEPNSESDCQSSLENIALSATHTYTGDTLTVTGTAFCEDDNIQVFIDDNIANIIRRSETEISFLVPTLSTSSIEVRVESNEDAVTIPDKVTLYPSGGTWFNTSQFSAESRRNFETTSGTNGYLLGGNKYLGYINSEYSFKYYYDVHIFKEGSNSWSEIALAEPLESFGVSAVEHDNILYVCTRSFENQLSRYDLSSGAVLESTAPFQDNALGFPSDVNLLNLGGEIYLAYVRGSTVLIKKYDTVLDSWEDVNSISMEDIELNFILSYQDKLYVGYNIRNTNTLHFVEIDPGTGTVENLESIGFDNRDTIVAKHLFTIGSIAYFTEVGWASVGPSSSEVLSPADRFYLYNFEQSEWKVVSHSFPGSVFDMASFSLNGRYFAGLGTSANGSAGFTYSTNLYEFFPE